MTPTHRKMPMDPWKAPCTGCLQPMQSSILTERPVRFTKREIWWRLLPRIGMGMLPLWFSRRLLAIPMIIKLAKLLKQRTDGRMRRRKTCTQNQTDGDAHANSDTEDNEAYIGFDSKNQKVTLTDSEAGDDTVYSKHSSNQEGIEGLEGEYETYPISNNEDNNGNCWIGRPLIAADAEASITLKSCPGQKAMSFL